MSFLSTEHDDGMVNDGIDGMISSLCGRRSFFHRTKSQCSSPFRLHHKGNWLSMWIGVIVKWEKQIYGNYTSSARTSRGRKFRRKKTISQRKNLPIECAQGDRPARCPNHFFAVNEPSAVPWWWCDLFWCHEVACRVRCSNVLGCEVTWGELLWLVATWHVMSCHLMCWSCHLMRCDCLCCVMSHDAMRCHVMCAHVKSCHLLCPAMGWNVMRLNRHYSLNNYSYYKVLLQYYSNTTLYFKVLLQYYSVLLQYYSVLQSTTPVHSLCTTKYYSSTTLTNKYRSSTTPYYKVLPKYYKVLLQYYSVLQSTIPVLLRTTKYYCTTKYNASTT